MHESTWQSLLRQLAAAAGVDVEIVSYLEARFRRPAPDAAAKIRKALEDGGVIFIGENGGGVGARLNFNRRDVRAINRWEQEGGTAGEDVIW